MSRRRLLQVLLTTVVTVCLLVLSGVSSAQGQSDEAFERVKAVQERHTEKFMAKDGVIGTAVGLNNSQRYAVMILLERPGIGGIPQQLDGVPVQPVLMGRIYALKPPGASGSTVDATARFERPVPIGVSTGHPAITAGTIACRVRNGDLVYALSNNHVYANMNGAVVGDNVLQPGVYDGGLNPGDAIGTLADFEIVKFDGSPNTIDAAIALTSAEKLGTSTPSDGYGTPKTTPATPHVGLRVQKYGRTTKLTTGRIHALNATANVYYGARVALFTKQIIITPGVFSAGGDSGSLVVTNDKNDAKSVRPVGLVFAGSSQYTIANPIDLVLDRFGVTVDGE